MEVGEEHMDQNTPSSGKAFRLHNLKVNYEFRKRLIEYVI